MATVNNYKTGALVGVLADFTDPTGLCADSKGDVYIVDGARKKIYEYAHGGTKAITTLSDSPYTPNGCSIDPLTGNLAVANSSGTSSGGNVALYTQARGKPALLMDKSITDFLACAYNKDGILLVTGTFPSSPLLFAWLRRRSDQLVNVKVPGPSPSWKWYVSGIQWDGMFFVLDEPQGAYQIALLDDQAYYVGETPFARGGQGQYAVYEPDPKHRGTQILVGSAATSSSAGSVGYLPYPGGGQPDQSFTHGVYNPFGIVVSLKQ
jgi:hypothetical protein